ncbi:hypothetical protein [Accumulibacter sp.]|uniref:hypothetical protein n=1 Tax=Accumulibacter sp. TaxID=2053492 RepID=UPI0026002B62|nr:hypothetical protein [Accumulibacter sp.]MCM8614087.1 hypothetical protein [Accumulibacter sp.]MCM8637889.1 hypothetical protein [Accumulibacter sp.]MCM8641296.1 hypothetical protein [Accumulibacter sp.]
MIALLIVPLFAQARQSVPIVDYPDNAVLTSSGKALTVEQVRQAITAAAQSHSWQVSGAPNGGGLQAVLNVRGKHTVVVAITYSPQTYSIVYHDSTNMNYSHDPNTHVRIIHPYYNRWVAELRDAIRMELNRL